MPRASHEVTGRGRVGMTETPMRFRETHELSQELTTFGNDRSSFFLAYDAEQANRDSSLGQ